MSDDATRSQVCTLTAKEVEKHSFYSFCVGKWDPQRGGGPHVPHKTALANTTQKFLMIRVECKILMISCKKIANNSRNNNFMPSTAKGHVVVCTMIPHISPSTLLGWLLL